MDGAVITVTPSRTGGSVDGGSWQMTPAAAQTITTGGHTQDDSFHLNGGDGSATWTVHYEVSKTSTSTLSGQEGPFTSQAEADAAAETAKNAAIGQLQNEAQGMVDAAIASARAQLANITFSYDEITIPHGFDSTPGALGSHQTITVPANSSNDYKMKNDECSVKVSIDKIDSETKQRIKGDAIDFEGYNPKKVILEQLRQKPEIDYEKCSKLLFKLITQVCDHYEIQYDTNGMQNIIMMYKRDIGNKIYKQMLQHFYCENGFLQEEVVGTRNYNLQQSYSCAERVNLFSDDYTGNIQSVLFEGVKRGVFSAAKFDSRPELVLARVLETDTDVQNWLRPAPQEFNITYNHGHNYEPDFVVETDDTIYLLSLIHISEPTRRS